jgi:hypothetical protein
MEKPGKIIGSSERTYDPRTNDGRSPHDHILESKMWGDIHRWAKTDPALQDALDRVILLYHLGKK